MRETCPHCDEHGISKFDCEICMACGGSRVWSRHSSLFVSDDEEEDGVQECQNNGHSQQVMTVPERSACAYEAKTHARWRRRDRAKSLHRRKK